ncbi:uncharacterized protein LOC132716883 [Ruditapes philippinarum]|uniref:uncharacterized protein LOC132716883 n=1 Tax=Ruditapes philippinarum TaxID=129788 RepID=UPI00295BC705|nr:uncharacterized protein LOC132716883 [Ruditapes philippinarum]
MQEPDCFDPSSQLSINQKYFNKNIGLNSYDNIFWEKGVNDKNYEKSCFCLSWNHSFHRNTKQYGSTLQGQSKFSILSNQIKSCNRYITIWKSCGRMGNQMFQVASVIGIAYQYDMTPLFPYKMLYIYFNLPNRYDTNLQHVENSTNCLCSKTATFKSCKESWNSTRTNVPVSPFVNAGDDMALKTLCDHVIVTAGTFGWWGAWLSGGITVYYKGYPGHNLSNRFNLFDYYPSHWIGL